MLKLDISSRFVKLLFISPQVILNFVIQITLIWAIPMIRCYSYLQLPVIYFTIKNDYICPVMLFTIFFVDSQCRIHHIGRKIPPQNRSAKKCVRLYSSVILNAQARNFKILKTNINSFLSRKFKDHKRRVYNFFQCRINRPCAEERMRKK